LKPKLFESSGVRCPANFEVIPILAAQVGLPVATCEEACGEARKALVGGDPCGARIHTAYHFCSDGILSSVPLLKIVKEKDKSLSESVSEMPEHPMLRKNTPSRNDAKFIVEDKRTNLKELFPKYKDSPAIDGTRLTFKKVRVLIKASGTELLVRFTSLAQSISTAREIMEENTRLVRERIGEKRK
jgi:phosphomannomutase